MRKSDRGRVNRTGNDGILRLLKAYMTRHRLGELLVMKGMISTADLRFALSQQKTTQKPLGQIFIKHAMISRRQLSFILARQTVLRTLAACMFFAASVMPTKRAKADTIKDVPAMISVSAPSISDEFARAAAYPGLFGTEEKRSGNLSPFTKWTSMFSRFERELNTPDGSRVMAEFRENLKSIQGQSLKSMADQVNRLVNKTPYIVDSKNWGKSDYWATPVEFIERGGDCEDFAIAKYVALRALGVPEERLRVAIVHDKQKNIPHAVLAVYTDDDVYVLDNQNKQLVDASGNGRYRPIFSINRYAWWLHSAPGTATLVASAQ